MFFDRTVSLDYGDAGGLGVRVSKLRVAFDILKTDNDLANTAQITIYNLSEDSRKKIKQLDTTCILRAGYVEDIGEQMLFTGNVQRITHQYQLPDILSVLQMADGSVALRDSRSSLSFASGTNAVTILKRFASDFNLQIRTLPVGYDANYPNGFSFAGSTRLGMNRVAERLGLQWSIQNGEIVFIPRKKSIQNTAILISSDTGLLGSPEALDDLGAELSKEYRREKREIKAAAKKKALVDDGIDMVKPGWTVRTLLNPRLEPGGLVQLDSRDVKGVFVISDVHHKGDTHGQEWTPTIEVHEL